MSKSFTQTDLTQQADQYEGSAGQSQGNAIFGLVPAFRDSLTNQVYRSCDKGGHPAPIHLLDGLPDELVLTRQDDGTVTEIKDSVEAGFLYQQQFYSRDEAILLVAQLSGAQIEPAV